MRSELWQLLDDDSGVGLLAIQFGVDSLGSDEAYLPVEVAHSMLWILGRLLGVLFSKFFAMS